jgi:hypothetical protein
MTELEKAQKWFNSKAIGTHINDDQLYLYVQGFDQLYEVLVSTSEVIYRAELYDLENNS